ncbi:MAG: sortase [Candidatus Doudnabacteria bacterium]|nr:sortase [Candidatus Doudnabacteria bacterium]
MKNYIIRISVIIVILLGTAVALNWDYVVLRVQFAFNKDDASSESSQELTEPNKLRIPSLNIEAPIQFITETNETEFQKALAHGVVHYPNTALAGQPGNMYVFGHSSDLPWSKGEYKTVFALLPQIKSDAEIFVSDDKGKEYKYKVLSTKVVAPTDLSVLDQQENKRKLLSVQTSYPVGTALKRFVVIAELVE